MYKCIVTFILWIGLSIMAHGQGFTFLPAQYSAKLQSHQIAGNYQNLSSTAYGDVVTVQSDDWSLLPYNQYANEFTYKSVQDFVKIYVNHDTLVHVPAYSYTFSLQLKLYDINGGSSTQNVSMTIDYNPDSLHPYRDVNVYKFANSHKFTVTVLDIQDNNNNLASVPRSSLATNFTIEPVIEEQRYDLQPSFSITTSSNAINSKELAVAVTTRAFTPNCGSTAPVSPVHGIEYELEWTYVDDYHLNPYDATPSPSYRFLTSSNVPYDFRKNSTRVHLQGSSYTIPLIYEHGAVVYRVRGLRPTPASGYKDIAYTDWTLPDNGVLNSSSSCFNWWGYLITQPHTADSLNWQYSISFAEQGRFKHVVNYFDGALKERQTQTKINSDNNYIIAADKVYDYEGRPAIQTLPTPVLQTDLGYRKGLLIDSVTGHPLSAASFDNGNCSSPTLINPLANTSLDKIYYSPLNPDMSGMQKYLPDAKGYPFVQSIYSPDNTNKLLWQGGAGKDLQLWNNHGSQYEYTRVMQPEIDRLLGTEAGKYAFYPKQVTTDGNGQSSITVLDPQGKTVLTALSGDVDTVSQPLSYLSNYIAGDSICADLLYNMDQDKKKDRLIANTSFYNDNTGINRLRYSVSIPGYPICDSFLQVRADYKVSISKECSTTPEYSLSDSAGHFTSVSPNKAIYGNSGVQTLTGLPKGKYLVNKELIVSEYDVKQQVGNTIKANAPNCFKDDNYFIRQAVEARTFPCTEDVPQSDCDKLLQQMIKELYPGAKYGNYTVNSNNNIYGDGNSIFTYTPPVIGQQGIPLPNVPISKGYFGRSTAEQLPIGTDTSWHAAVNLTDQGVIANNGGPIYPADMSGSTAAASAYASSFIGYVPMSLWVQPSENFVSSMYLNLAGTGPEIWFKNKIFISDTLLLTDYNSHFSINWRTVPGCGYISKVAINGDSTVLDGTGISCNSNSNGIQCWTGSLTLNRYTTGGLHLGWNDIAVKIGNGDCYSSNSANNSTGYINGMYGWSGQPQYVHIFFSSDCTTCGINLPQGTPTIPGYYRYQSSCIGSFPAMNIGTSFYTSFANVTPQMLVDNFNDQIAEKLLPLHPEYCKLLACDNGFRDQLDNLETFQQADAAGLLSLNDIIAHDPIYINSGYSNTVYSQLSTLPGNVLGKDFQTLAMENAYCAAGNLDEQSICAAYLYGSQISGFSFGNDDIEQKYFETIKSFYLSNRDRIVEQMKGSTGCGPCMADRMTLTGDPILPTVADGAGNIDLAGMGLPTWYTDLFSQAQNGNNTSTIPQQVTDSINQARADEADGMADEVVKRLSNCISTSNMANYAQKMNGISIAIKNIINGGGTLTPQAIKNILTDPNINIPLTDLCHPFLVAYGLYDVPEDKEVTYECATDDLYSGMTSFFNNASVRNALTSGGTTSPNYTLTLGTDPFSNNIREFFTAAYGPPSGPLSIDVQKINTTANVPFAGNTVTVNFDKLKVNLSGQGTYGAAIYFYIRKRSASSSDYVNVSMNVNNFICLNNDAGAMNDGLVAGKTAIMLANINGQSAVDTYYVWNDRFDIMQRYTNASMSTCVTCVDIKNAMRDFQNDQANYGYNKAINHPLAERTITNYLNYKLKKTFSFNEYYDLMKGCALSDSVFIDNISGDFIINFNDTTHANAFADNLNRPYLVDYRVLRGSPPNPYVPNPFVQVYINMKNIAEDSLLWYKELISNTGWGAGATDLGYMAQGPTTVFSNNVNLAIAWVGTEPIKFYENGGYRDYAIVTDPNVWVSSFTKSDLISYFASYCTPATGAFYISGNRLMRPDDYTTTARQGYLSYVHSQAGRSHQAVVGAIAPDSLKAHIPDFAGKTVTYEDPYCTGTKTDVYLYSQPSASHPGYSLLNTILTQVKNANSNKLFPNTTASTINSSLKLFKKLNGTYWYRYFKAPNNNKLYNVYLTPPKSVTDPENYTFSSMAVLQGDDSIYNFTVTMQNGSFSFTCTGHTDFSIGYCKKLSNVVLQKRDKIVCYDSADCEHDELMAAVTDGKAAYYLYFDSVKNDLSARMMTYVINNTKDSLRLCTQDQKYQYTLYYYDLAGNLTRTVPPQGVNMVSSSIMSLVDVYRSSPYTTLSKDPIIHHAKQTEYNYNSQNKLTYSKTPDGGETYFFYDDAGRLVFSQNSAQRLTGYYSYILYDQQSRVMETGEVMLGCAKTDAPNIFNVGYCSTVSQIHPAYVTEIPDMPTLTSYIRARIQKRDVVLTLYDTAAADIKDDIDNTYLSPQENLRKRVSAIYYWQSLGNVGTNVPYAPANPYFATYYSYDVSGNVKTTICNFKTLAQHDQQYKRVDYEYDLLSGKLNMIAYNRGKTDQFFQKYDYDADNRLTMVQTSNEGIIWDKDARYSYYRHGPLAKAEIGDAKVQSLEYAYTIQGWLKSINGELRRPDKDMGGNGGSNDATYARDIVSHTLDYYAGDYASIGSGAATPPAGLVSLHNFNDPAKNLYNGNIVRQTTSIGGLSHDSSMQRTYRYDQLQRLLTAKNAWVNESSGSVLTPSQLYQSSYSYDKDGNIQTLTRQDKGAALIDNFAYHYTANNPDNRLNSVSDAVTANASTGTDLKSGQPTDNYQYDKSGNLVKDKQGHLNMLWNYTGKLTKVTDTVSGRQVWINYDGKGNRIYKETITPSNLGPFAINDEDHDGEYYVRDATGNILAVYKVSGHYDLRAIITHDYSDGVSLSTPDVLTDFTVDHFGSIPDFTSGFLKKTMTDAPDWGESLVAAKPPSFFLANDQTVMHNTLLGTQYQYMPDLLSYDLNNSQSIIPAALSTSPDYDISTPIVSLGDTNIDHRYFNYFQQSLPLSEWHHIWEDLGLNYDEVNPDVNSLLLIQTFIDNPTRDIAPDVASQMQTIIANHILNDDITPVRQFYNAVLADPNIYTSAPVLDAGISFTIATALNQVQDATVSDNLMNFFDQYAPATEIIRQNNSTLQLLGDVYTADPTTVLGDWVTNRPISTVAIAVSEIPGFTVRDWDAAYDDGFPGGGTRDPGGPVVTPHYDCTFRDTMSLAEHHIYGSSRLGIKTYDSLEIANVANNCEAYTPVNNLSNGATWYSKDYGDLVLYYEETPWNHWDYQSFPASRFTGKKRYELTDHLGNVLATILDRKTGSGSTGYGTLYDHWNADIASATDYYPGGMMMPGRNTQYAWSRNSFNTQQKDDEIYGAGNLTSAEYWEYDTRRWGRWNVDPVTMPWTSSYVVNGNNPILYSDPDGALFGIKGLGSSREQRQQAGNFANQHGGTIKNKWSSSIHVDYTKGYRFSESNTDNGGYTSENASQYFNESGGAIDQNGTISQATINSWGSLKNTNVIGSTLYSIANGLYTLPQQLLSGLSGQRGIANLDNSGYSTTDPTGEKQRTANFVDGATVLVPGAEGAGAYTSGALTNAEGFLLGSIKIKLPFDLNVGLYASEKSIKYNAFSYSTKAPKAFFSTQYFGRSMLQITTEFQARLGPYMQAVIPKGTPIKIGIIGPQAGNSIGIPWFQFLTESPTKLK